MRLHTSTYKNFGFALVATVSMMVLLTLVAIAMLSLSTIEQRSSGGGANEADRMARANARMALMMALGELQKAAGPDQRVSATATLLGSAANCLRQWHDCCRRKKTLGWSAGTPVAIAQLLRTLRPFSAGWSLVIKTAWMHSLMLAPPLPLMMSPFLKGLMQRQRDPAYRQGAQGGGRHHFWQQFLLRLLGRGRGGEGGPGVE